MGSFNAMNYELGGWLKQFVNLPSIFITLGGTISATLIHYPMPQVMSIFPILKNVFSTSTETPNEAIETLVSLAEKARREGLLSLESDVDMQENEFLKKGIQLVIDGTDPELVREIMEIELEYLEERHKVGVGLFEAMGFYSPAFGLVGTLIGLIAMLESLGEDVGNLGPKMAIALVTTLYGAVFANLLALPIAGKLKVRSGEEITLKQVMIQGIICIQEGNNPRIVRQKLMSFLAPKVRREMEAAGEGGERRAA
ncbi:MAG TPA: motility protein A [bacterium]|nr:motility protein A [bacterium]